MEQYNVKIYLQIPRSQLSTTAVIEVSPVEIGLWYVLRHQTSNLCSDLRGPCEEIRIGLCFQLQGRMQGGYQSNTAKWMTVITAQPRVISKTSAKGFIKHITCTSVPPASSLIISIFFLYLPLSLPCLASLSIWDWVTSTVPACHIKPPSLPVPVLYLTLGTDYGYLLPQCYHRLATVLDRKEKIHSCHIKHTEHTPLIFHVREPHNLKT